MKKLLLFTLSLLIGASIYAQSGRFLNNHSKAHETLVVNTESQIPDFENVALEVNDYVANRDQDIIFGTSYYDVQSNAAVPRHIHVFDDGTIGSIWTMSQVNDPFPGCPDRGTGYNYFDGTSWGTYPTARIETERTGWPSYAAFGVNGEIVCAHTGDLSLGLQFSWRENKGTGAWNYFNLLGPAGHEDVIWPKMMTSGENNDIIHVLAQTTPSSNGGSAYEGLDGALLYYKSTDGGQTWDIEHEILDGLTSEDIGHVGADSYCWAHPKDGVIAFALNNGVAHGNIFKSEDQGNSWETIKFFNAPFPLEDGTAAFPVYYASDGTTDLLIDDEGKMHIAFGRTYRTSEGGGMQYNAGVDGLVYWNEDKPVMDSTLLGDVDAMEEAGVLAAWALEDYDTGDTIMGVTAINGGLTGQPQLAFNRDANDIPIITIFYASYDAFRDPDGNGNTRRSIYSVTTEDGGATWSEFTNYFTDVFHLDKTGLYPSIASTNLDGTYHLVYQSDGFAGNGVNTDGHPVVLNNMVYLPVSPLAVDVEENMAQSFEVSQNYPNPVNGQTYFNIKLNEGADLNLEVYSLTGQKVSTANYGYKAAGSHTLTINASNLASGVYFYTVSTVTDKVTRKMIVQ